MQITIDIDEATIQQIAGAILKELKPSLTNTGEAKIIPIIFDKKGLSEYLGVDLSWISRNMDAIPHFKVGKYVRFKRAHIDSWIEASKSVPGPYLKLVNKLA